MSTLGREARGKRVGRPEEWRVYWDREPTDKLELEQREIQAEIESMQAQLATRAVGERGWRDYDWERRTRTALSFRRRELRELLAYLGERRTRSAKAADRKMQEAYVRIASKELPSEWHEYLTAKASEEAQA